MRKPTLENLLTVKEVADKIRVTPATVREWIKAGELMALNIGSGRMPRYRIPPAALEDKIELVLPAR